MNRLDYSRWNVASASFTKRSVTLGKLASQREIRRIVAPTMLLGADVLDLKSRKWQVTLQQAAILTPVFRSIADQLTNRFIHAQAGVLRNIRSQISDSPRDVRSETLSQGRVRCLASRGQGIAIMMLLFPLVSFGYYAVSFSNLAY